jgi:hypothetical protein
MVVVVMVMTIMLMIMVAFHSSWQLDLLPSSGDFVIV